MEWISVDDQLPAEARRVLVYGRKRNALEHQVGEGYRAAYWGDPGRGVLWHMGPSEATVTHWMPFPPPPGIADAAG